VRQVTAECAVPPARGWELRRLAQRGGICPVESRAHGPLGRFQIDALRVAPSPEHHPQAPSYFARDLLPNRFDRFFSASFPPPPPEAANDRSPRWFPETHE